MPVDIDGYAVLGAIAANAAVFAAVEGEAVKTARGLVVKQLKDKGTTVEGLKAVAAALGPEPFDLIADALSPAEVKALLARLDKQNASIRTEPAEGQRRHLVDLARGHASPTAKAAAVKPPKAKAARAPKAAVERAGNSKAMRASKRT